MEEIHQKLEELGKKFSHRVPGQEICHGMLQSQTMPKTIIDKIPGFKLYDSDTIVAGYPKSGTTWLQEIVYLIVHDVDTSTSKQTPTYVRVPLLEDRRTYAMIENNRDQRVFKTHMTSNMLPRQIHEKKAKIVYIARNPKDTAVSMYHFYKSCEELGNFDGSWSEFLEMFEEGYVVPSRWFEHVLGWWQLQDDLSNLLIVKYEDLLRNSAATVVRIANFLGKKLDPSSLQTILDFTSFQSMTSNPMSNFASAVESGKLKTPFLRKGQVGDWKKHFTVAQSEHFDELYNKRMRGIDLKLDFE